MANIHIDLTSIPQCSKRGCTHRGLMHRHHLGHQWIWVKAFASTRHGTKRYKAFVKSYSRFNKKDIELLCPGHHGEIHELYDEMIQHAVYKCMLPLSLWSWPQANKLMSSLRSRYMKWKNIKTSISNPPTERLEHWERYE